MMTVNGVQAYAVGLYCSQIHCSWLAYLLGIEMFNMIRLIEPNETD